MGFGKPKLPSLRPRASRISCTSRAPLRVLTVAGLDPPMSGRSFTNDPGIRIPPENSGSILHDTERSATDSGTVNSRVGPRSKISCPSATGNAPGSIVTRPSRVVDRHKLILPDRHGGPWSRLPRNASRELTAQPEMANRRSAMNGRSVIAGRGTAKSSPKSRRAERKNKTTPTAVRGHVPSSWSTPWVRRAWLTLL